MASSYLEPGKGAEVGTVLDVDHISRTTGRSSPIAVLGAPRHRGRHLLLSLRAVPLNALTNVDDDFSTLRNPRAGAAFRGTFVRSFEASRRRKIKIRSRTEAPGMRVWRAKIPGCSRTHFPRTRCDSVPHTSGIWPLISVQSCAGWAMRFPMTTAIATFHLGVAVS